MTVSSRNFHPSWERFEVGKMGSALTNCLKDAQHKALRKLVSWDLTNFSGQLTNMAAGQTGRGFYLPAKLLGETPLPSGEGNTAVFARPAGVVSAFSPGFPLSGKSRAAMPVRQDLTAPPPLSITTTHNKKESVMTEPDPNIPACILALDLGQKTGWALKRPDGRIYSGTETFKPDRFSGGGMALLRFRQWLDTLHGTGGPVGMIVFEEVRRHLGTTAAHIYGGFLGQLSAWAEFREIPYEGVPVGTIKKFIAGKGNANKEDVIRAVFDRGFCPQDDNEADALALLLWALEDGPARGGAA